VVPNTSVHHIIKGRDICDVGGFSLSIVPSRAGTRKRPIGKSDRRSRNTSERDPWSAARAERRSFLVSRRSFLVPDQAFLVPVSNAGFDGYLGMYVALTPGRVCRNNPASPYRGNTDESPDSCVVCCPRFRARGTSDARS
jgi:hypothetical protein